MDLTFTVEVDFTDRRRHPAGGFVTATAFVEVMADTDTDATLTAAQMVGGSIPADFMVTATRITDIAT